VDVVTVEQSNPARASSVGRPSLVEVLGPAASGKTTLARWLGAHHPGIRAGMGIGKLGHLSSIGTIGALVPLWVRHHRRDRWLDRREMRSIARLETWQRALDRGQAPPADAIVFDHGPLYRLARLRAFGPSLTRSEPFRDWWQQAYRYWIEALDLVVWLEAPDDVLLDRVDRRGHWYLSAEPDVEARREFLASYRRAFERVLDPSDPAGTARTAPAVLRIRSDRLTTEKIAEQVLAALAAAPEQEAPR